MPETIFVLIARTGGKLSLQPAIRGHKQCFGFILNVLLGQLTWFIQDENFKIRSPFRISKYHPHGQTMVLKKEKKSRIRILDFYNIVKFAKITKQLYNE